MEKVGNIKPWASAEAFGPRHVHFDYFKVCRSQTQSQVEQDKQLGRRTQLRGAAGWDSVSQRVTQRTVDRLYLPPLQIAGQAGLHLGVQDMAAKVLTSLPFYPHHGFTSFLIPQGHARCLP